MTEIADLQLIFTKIDEAQVSLGAETQADIAELQSESDEIAELVDAAQELSEPPQAFFTRG